MKRRIPKGGSSKRDYVFIKDSAGAPKTSLLFNTSGLKCYYVRDGVAATAITLVTIAAVTSAYTSAGFLEVDATNAPGLYRFDPPNALFADGSDAVRVIFSGASIAAFGVEYEITDDVPVQFSGTATAGGASTVTLPAAASAVDNYYKRALLEIIAGTGAGQSPGFCTGYVGATKVATVFPAWQVQPDNTSVIAIRAFGVDAVTTQTLVNAIFDELLSAHTIKGSLGARLALAHVGTAQAGAGGSITLATAASATNDAYADDRVQITGGTGAGQTNEIASYNGTTKVALVRKNWVVTPDATSEYQVIPDTKKMLADQAIDAILDDPMTKMAAGDGPPATWTPRIALKTLMALSLFPQKVNRSTGVITIRDEGDTGDIMSCTVSDDGTITIRPAFSN